MKSYRTSFDFPRIVGTVLILAAFMASSASANLLLSSYADNRLYLNPKAPKTVDRQLKKEDVISLINTSIETSLLKDFGNSIKCILLDSAPKGPESNIANGVEVPKVNEIDGYFGSESLALPEKSLFSFYKCAFTARTVPMAIVYRYKAVGNAAGEILVLFRHEAQTKAHPYEFAMKRNISVNPEAIESGVAKEELNVVIKDIGEHLDKVKLSLAVPDNNLITNQVWSIFEKCFKDASKGSAGSVNPKISCPSYPCFFQHDVTIAADCQSGNNESTKILKLEMRINKADAATGLSEINLQLGSSHFSMKIPFIPETETAESDGSISKNLYDNFKNWVEAIDLENQPVTLHEAGQALINLIAGSHQCYQSDKTTASFTAHAEDGKKQNEEVQPENGVSSKQEVESSNFFFLTLTMKTPPPEDKKCDLIYQKVDSVSKKIEITLMIYQYNYFNYVQVFLDSPMQSAEYLIDSSKAKFTSSLGTELAEFMEDDAIVVEENSPIIYLTLEKISAYITPKLPGVECTAQPNSKSMSCNTTTSKSPVVLITEVELPSYIYRIKFIYPKAESVIASTGTDSSIVTNQLVFQKYNAFDQLKRLDKPLAVLAPMIKK